VASSLRTVRARIGLTWDWAARRPWFWAALYLLAIPAAAGVFAIDGHHFADSNLAREPGTTRDVASLSTALTQVLVKDAAATRIVTGGQQYVVGPASRVVQIVRGQGPVGTLAVEVFAQLASAHGGVEGPHWFELGPQEAIVGANLPSPAYLYAEQSIGLYGVGNATLPPLFAQTSRALFKNRLGARSSLVVTGPIAAKFERLSGAFAGDPAEASGLYLRMLYLSATTITTLGLGDIQPLSSSARTWVSVEAVAGIVLAGFFLNAVATRRRGEADAK
jgi:hypothetical protein